MSTQWDGVAVAVSALVAFVSGMIGGALAQWMRRPRR